MDLSQPGGAWQKGMSGSADHDVRPESACFFRTFGDQTSPSLESLLDWLQTSSDLTATTASLPVGRFYWVPRTMASRGAAAQSWHLPALTTPAQLAHWLDLTPSDLDWLADVHGWTTKCNRPKLHHYVYRWQERRRGRFRLIESPKPRLKGIQRKILHEILDRIPAHAAVHGFHRGRSILSYATPHAGKAIVLRFDLRDFFTSVRASRVHALFQTAGYPPDVARLLAGLCTSRVPSDMWENRPQPRTNDARLGERLRGRHLPQGAPTSPALGNACAYRLDIRLAGLAQSCEAVYTRYADDLAFSGGETCWERRARRFQVAVAVIVAEEGFEMHFQKSRFMRRGVCQQLSGIVVNEHPNVKRDQYDQLKAILTNCVRHGPDTQNRGGHADFRSHLLGNEPQREPDSSMPAGASSERCLRGFYGNGRNAFPLRCSPPVYFQR